MDADSREESVETMKYAVGQPVIGDAEAQAVLATVRSGWLTQGERVRQFEKELADLLHVNDVVVCSSGTAALHLSLAAFGIGPGDEVLVPDVTYVATANAVTYVGATPVLVDIEPTTWNINLDDAEQQVSARTKAILPVHLYGCPCDMDAVLDFAQEHSLVVIEDAAEALGAYWRGVPCGAWGHCGTFSFYANKCITSGGEGGAVTTNDPDIAETLRFLRGQAQSPVRRFWHGEIGFNYRMTDLQAAIGLAQLTQLPTFLAERQRVVNGYRELLRGVITSPTCYRRAAPWLYTGLLPIGHPYYRGVEERMAGRDIEVRPVFVPMHRLPMYARPDAQFPVACLVGDFGVSLPTHPALTDDDVQFIAFSLMDVLGVEQPEEAHAETH
jgi:perosamine synthetase